MKIKADGYYIQVRNLDNYPQEWVSLKITNNDTSKYWFGGGSITRTAVFKTYKEARKTARKQITIFQKKHNGKFEYLIRPIKLVK